MRRLGRLILGLMRHASIWLVLAAFLAPIAWLLWGAAGSDPHDLFAPVRTLAAIRDAQGGAPLQTGMLSSLRVSGVVALVCLFLAPTAAYALSRARFPGRRPILVFFALVLFAPVTLLVVPLEIVLFTVGLHDTYTGLILSQLGLALALSTWIVKRAFDRLPPELEECARLEGASQGRIFRTVAVPAVRLHVACATAIAFASSWGEYLFATTFLTKAEHFTIAAVIVSAARPTLPPWDRFAPVAFIAALPTVLLLLLVQTRLGDLIQLDRLAPRPPRET